MAYSFQFIIQADFDAQANRQDIVTSSQRNVGLFESIADAFVKATLQFCEHETLQYLWVSHLPIENSYSWAFSGGDWQHWIWVRLQGEAVRRPRTLHRLKRIGDLKRRPHDTNDGKGDLLFVDLIPELYLSDHYKPDDLSILEKVGLGAISNE